MIGLIAGGLSAQPSIAAAAPGSCLGFASRGCLVQGAERGGGGKEKRLQNLVGKRLFCYFFICVACAYQRFLGTACGGTRGEPGTAAVPRCAQGDVG